MSIKALSDYTFYSRYARYDETKKRRETWEEAVSRVFEMHKTKYATEIENTPELLDVINFAQQMQNKKRVLAAQRSLQFAGPSIFKHELKMYNCLFSHIDRERVFQETMYSLLCGCGVGFSVQTQHVSKIGKIRPRTEGIKTYIVDDSIEGWADAIGVLVNSFFENPVEFKEYGGFGVVFDFSNIRPEGSLIAGQFKAPGYKGLQASLEKVSKVIETRLNSEDFNTGEFKGKLRPIDAYDVIMHISDAVLSGGVRRSATLAIFSKDDLEMMTAKTGNWANENPQRGRSNNSVALLRGNVSREEFHKIIENTKEFGEPGFIWTDDLESGHNPCVEINLYPKTADGRSGFQACNLTEINGKWCSTKERFLEACRASAIIGTLQAGYTNLKYLGEASKEIFQQEALLGCSITGWMDNPDILFDPLIQQEGAKLILATNEIVAKMIGIKPTARATCAKPSGSTSCLLGTASGIHPHHAKKYIRRVQANKTEFCLQQTEAINPSAIEESVWSANKTDKVISFLCEVPIGSIVKNQLSAVELLEKVKLSQQNWIEYGTVKERGMRPSLKHNISNTITVKPDEWLEVENFIFDNQLWFAGISLLSSSGDLDYSQAPFSTVLTPTELVKEYGDASIFASGLIVDGLHAYNNDLWKACDELLGRAEKFDPQHVENVELKIDWIRRANQFAARYFNSDNKLMTYCLKHVSLWKTWCDLKREYKEIDWEQVVEEAQTYVNADTLGSQACSGGACEIL